MKVFKDSRGYDYVDSGNVQSGFCQVPAWLADRLRTDSIGQGTDMRPYKMPDGTEVMLPTMIVAQLERLAALEAAQTQPMAEGVRAPAMQPPVAPRAPAMPQRDPSADSEAAFLRRSGVSPHVDPSPPAVRRDSIRTDRVRGVSPRADASDDAVANFLRRSGH